MKHINDTLINGKTESLKVCPMKDKIHPILKVKYLDDSDLKRFKEKAIPVQSAQNELETPVYRSITSPKEIVKDFPNIKTMQELFENSVKHFGNNKFLGTRYPINKGWTDYQFKTYNQVNEDRIAFGSGLMRLYNDYVIQKQDSWFLGIFSINRYEWIVAELGAGAHSIPNVALYDTLGPETSEYILNHAEVPVLVTSVDKVAGVLELVPKCPTLKIIIVMESLFTDQTSPIPVLKKWGAQLGVTVVTFREVLELGKKKPVPKRMPKGDDLLCLSYTSGTTGNPKGAMLSHTNLVSTVRAAAFTVLLGPEDSHISYLPLAHIFERVMIANIMMVGASAGFFRGEVSLLVEDIGVLKPTFFASVPRLLNRIHDKIIQGALHSGSKVKATLFSKALESKLYYLEKEGSLTHPLWDRLVFNKVKQVLGGRLRIIITASAPISSQVLSFLRVACGCQVVEGYGQTESCGGLTVTLPHDYSTGNVGSVIPNGELKLVSVPEMGYHAKDLKGEVWVRGNGVFKGYLKDKAKTEETITPDGWLKTGDIGTLDKYGRLSIVDRKKNIFKLSQGEYIAPEKLEATFLKSSFVAQIYVHGDSLQSELVAVVVPDQEYSIGYAIQNGLLPSNTPVPPAPVVGQPPHPLLVELSKKSEFKKLIFDDITKKGEEDKLRGFEFVKDIYVQAEMFSADNGLLTPTFKLKRADAAKKFRPQIDKMYKELENKKPPAKL